MFKNIINFIMSKTIIPFLNIDNVSELRKSVGREFRLNFSSTKRKIGTLSMHAPAISIVQQI
jgi:hypothetical protein